MIINLLKFIESRPCVINSLKELPKETRIVLKINRLDGNANTELSKLLSRFGDLRIIVDIQDEFTLPEILDSYPGLLHLHLRSAWTLRSFDNIGRYPALETLNLEGINPADKDLSVLTQLPKLKELTIVKITKGMEDLADCRSLERLTLHSISADNLQFLKRHPRLWWLSVVLGGIKNFDALTETKLKFLDLYQVRGPVDLDFVSQIRHLEYLRLAKLKEVERLPLFNMLKRLRRVSLTQMKGIRDLSPLLSAPALEEFIAEDFGHADPEDFTVLSKHPKLKRGAVRLGSTKKNEAVARLLPLNENYGPFVFSDGVSE